MSCEGGRLGQGCEIAEEVQGAGVEGGGQTFEEQASEQPGERFDGQEEVWSAGDPARAIGREAAARHDAVDVGMVRQRLPQVWRTATTPIPAPSRRGLAASLDIASAAALNRIA